MLERAGVKNIQCDITQWFICTANPGTLIVQLWCVRAGRSQPASSSVLKSNTLRSGAFGAVFAMICWPEW